MSTVAVPQSTFLESWNRGFFIGFRAQAKPKGTDAAFNMGYKAGVRIRNRDDDTGELSRPRSRKKARSV